MSYLRFEDRTDGVHVFFDDVTDNGPIGTVATFNETDIATLSRATAHSIRFEIDFKNGPGNDVVKIFIDGKKAITGTTWENYYRYDPEASGSGNQVPHDLQAAVPRRRCRDRDERRQRLPRRRRDAEVLGRSSPGQRQGQASQRERQQRKQRQ